MTHTGLFNKIVPSVVQSLLQYIYPPFCSICKQPSVQTVCDICAHEIELIDPSERCHLCFHERHMCDAPCQYCLHHPVSENVFGQACCLKHSEVVSLLLAYMKNRIHWDLEAALASFVFVQLERMKWPPFDLLTIEPSHWLLSNTKSITLSKRIGKQLAALLHIPYIQARINPFSLPDPHIALEDQRYSDEIEISLPTKQTLTGMKILTLSLIAHKGTSWKALSKNIEPYGLSNVWNIALVENFPDRDNG